MRTFLLLKYARLSLFLCRGGRLSRQNKPEETGDNIFVHALHFIQIQKSDPHTLGRSPIPTGHMWAAEPGHAKHWDMGFRVSGLELQRGHLLAARAHRPCASASFSMG